MKTLALILLAAGLHAEGGAVIVLDPGHGGRDRGAVVRGVQENALTLAIANKVADELRGIAGLVPFLTRKEDLFVALSDRVDLAEQAGGKVFLSLHADKVDGRKPKGVFVWYYGANKRVPKGPPREATERLRPAPPKELVTQSRLLAEHIQRALRRRSVKTASYADRGGFAVLKSDRMPSLLIEVGNMRDPAEWERMQEPAFQENLAKALAQGIAAYLTAGGL